MDLLNVIKMIQQCELNENEIIDILKEYPKIFKFIPEPSSTIKTKAIIFNSQNIKYVLNPQPELQMLSVKDDILNIKYIENLDADVERYAMDNMPDVFLYIKNPLESSKDIACLNGDLFKFVKKPTEEQCIQAVKTLNSNIQYIDEPSVDVQRLLSEENINFSKKIDSALLFKLIEDNPFIITKIDEEKMNESHIRFAITCDPTVFVYLSKSIQIKYFKHLESVLITSVKYLTGNEFFSKDDIVKCIKEDNEYIYILLLFGDIHDRIVYRDLIDEVCISNPEYASIFWDALHDNVTTYMLSKYGWLIENIDMPSLEQELISVMGNCDSIQYIKVPSKYCQEYVINKCPYLFKYINQPTIETINIAISKNPSNIRLVSNPSEFLILKSIRKDPSVIQFFDNQTAKMQRIAYKNNPSSVIYFKDVTDHDLKKRILIDNISMVELNIFDDISDNLIHDIYVINPEILLYLSKDRLNNYIHYSETFK